MTEYETLPDGTWIESKVTGSEVDDARGRDQWLMRFAAWDGKEPVSEYYPEVFEEFYGAMDWDPSKGDKEAVPRRKVTELMLAWFILKLREGYKLTECKSVAEAASAMLYTFNTEEWSGSSCGGVDGYEIEDELVKKYKNKRPEQLKIDMALVEKESNFKQKLAQLYKTIGYNPKDVSQSL